jgi:RimJ/RimL family protein N-acetyltransferase
MPPTPLPYRPWPGTCRIPPLTEAEGIELAERLPDSPYFVLQYGYLRHGVARAFVAGSLRDPEAVIVQGQASPGEPGYFGRNPEAGWALLSHIPGWFCVIAPTEDMNGLLPIMERELRLPYHWLGDLHYTLEEAPRAYQHPLVRLLDVPDIPRFQHAPPQIQPGGYRTYEEALTEGSAAAAIIDDRIVALADNSASNRRYSDIGVFTLEPYRRRGLSSAAVYLVAQAVRARGRTPIWSTGSDNLASQRVAAKVGFQPYGRMEYVIFDRLKENGGYRPR